MGLIDRLIERLHRRSIRAWGGRPATRAELVAAGSLAMHCFAQGAALADCLRELADTGEAPTKPDGSRVTPFDLWPLAQHVEECYERTLNSVLALGDGREPDLTGDGLKEAYAAASATVSQVAQSYGPTRAG
ncbi:MAG: hypothetical protein F4Y41_08535 [Gammaproteobacteria bacterium]|nr:hypothetical protein [Gammaproteobacteria bacterium]MYI05742.1 hypothetical protein [Gemmatimonadota bacterium]